jgi:calcineurin-like phosphoesterase family protein
MTLDLRFAVVSDLHIGLPHTIFDHPSRFHLIEVSIPALEVVFEHLSQLNLDFLLIPGDLTQHGEPENHAWLGDRLHQLPFPVYVIPGNHDVPVPEADQQSIGWHEFPNYYRKFGYEQTDKLHYCTAIAPGVKLIGLNSNQFNEDGKQIGSVDDAQLIWLEDCLAKAQDDLILVMIHHNILEHFPNQTKHPIGQRYMLENAPAFLKILQRHNVQIIFTGHLHVQDIAYRDGIFDITTGSLVSYPHPYRVLRLTQQGEALSLAIESHRVKQVPEFPDLQHYSREWMGDRSVPFMTKMLCQPPLSLTPREAVRLAPDLRYFWADIVDGDSAFHFPRWPEPLRNHFESYGLRHPQEEILGIQDNDITLTLTRNPYLRSIKSLKETFLS